MAAGYAVTDTSNRADFAVARYNPDGSPDTTFDIDGKTTFSFGSLDDRANSVAIQSDGKIVVAGQTETSSNEDFAMARINTDGSLDSTFDTDGKVTTLMSSGHDRAYAAAIQADGKIVAAGTGGNIFALARYNTNGSLDTSFDGDGMVTTTFPNEEAGFPPSPFSRTGRSLPAGMLWARRMPISDWHGQSGWIAGYDLRR